MSLLCSFFKHYYLMPKDKWQRRNGRAICFPSHSLYPPPPPALLGITYPSWWYSWQRSTKFCLPHTFPSWCVCVCVCAWVSLYVWRIWDAGLFKERRWWHLCHLRPLFSMWEMAPLITLSTHTVCRSGGIIILFLQWSLVLVSVRFILSSIYM